MNNRRAVSNARSDADFLRMLEERVAENRVETSHLSGSLLRELAAWLGVHPWKVLIPLAVVVSLGLAVVLRGWLLVLVSMLQGGF